MNGRSQILSQSNAKLLPDDHLLVEVANPAHEAGNLSVGVVTLDDQIKELTKTVMDLQLLLARVDTKVDAIKDMQPKVEDHGNRLTVVEASVKRMERVYAWIGMAIGGSALAAVVAFIVKGGLSK